MLVGLIGGDFRLQIVEKVEDADDTPWAGSAAPQASQKMLSEKAVGSTGKHVGVLSAARRGQNHTPPPGPKRLVVAFRETLQLRHCRILGLTYSTRMATIEDDYNFPS